MAEGKALEPPPDAVRLAASGPGKGSHSAFFVGGLLVVDWYDHGEDVPFEMVNQLLFDAEGQRRLLGEESGGAESDVLNALARRFDSYWSVEKHCHAAGIGYAKLTDFDV